MKRKNFVYLAAALLILNTVIRFILDFSGDYPYNVFGTFSIIIIPLLLSVVLITQHSNKTIMKQIRKNPIYHPHHTQIQGVNTIKRLLTSR